MLYVAVYTFSLRPFVPIPPVVYTIAGGFTFGPLIGAPLAIVGATLNASLSYIVAKTLGRDFVEGYINNRFGSFNRMLSNNEFKTILLLRASPIGAPFDMVSYASGLLGVSFWTYFAATMLGIILVVGVYSYFGGSVGKRGIAPLVCVFVMLLLFILLPIYFKRRRNVSSEAVK